MNNTNKSIAIWLFTCALIVFLMVAVGGLTRLTQSGLSIVQWKPIHGIIPPLSDSDWNDEFNDYKQTPEYIKKNIGMELPEFKKIFWWEFIHRLIGRSLGIVFMIPLVYFTVKKQIIYKKALILMGIFALGGLQGFVGWWMVKSGLVDDPSVSHYRLATHLSIALIILALMFWQALGFYLPDLKDKIEDNKKAKFNANFLLFVIFVQIIFGAFMAGLHAGLTYNTWPFMDGKLIPAGIKLLLNNIEFVQFFHRWWAFFVLATVIHFTRMIKSGKIVYEDATTAKRLRKGLIILHSLVGTQILLGITALVSLVHVSDTVHIMLASAHQMVAVLVFLSALYIRRVIQ